MNLECFQPSFGASVHLNVRCLVGLFGATKEDGLDEAFSALLDQDQDEEIDHTGILNYALGSEDADRVQFLVGSQSLKQNESQVTLITLVESNSVHPTHLVKQTFAHPDGEVVGLTALPAQPNWFVTTFSHYSADRPDLRTGARVWRLPSLLSAASGGEAEQELGLSSTGSDDHDATQLSNTLDYVTTLPLDGFAHIRRVAASPSTNCADLACIVGPPIGNADSKGGGSSSAATAAAHAFTSHLVLLQAPSPSGSGDYRVSASAQLCLPPSAQIYTSYLKTNLGHLFKTAQSNGRVAITSQPNAIRWSTCQQAGQVAVAFDAGILGWDIRSMKPCYWLEAAHWPCVRDLDFNPHCPNLLVTGGDDGCVRLWDLRFLKSKLHPRDSVVQTGPSPHGGTLAKSTRTRQSWLSGLNTDVATEPLYSIQSHSHWVWSVRYHPTRDQLLLSSGSDSRVCLYNLSQFSSDIMLDDVHSPTESRLDSVPNTVGGDHTSLQTTDSDGSAHHTDRKLHDGLIARLEQHEDSVYAVDWSPVDPWYFASVSYDGNLLINQVPEPVKMHILLQPKLDDADVAEE